MKKIFIISLFIYSTAAMAKLFTLPPEEGRIPKIGMGYSTDWETLTLGECISGTPYYDGVNKAFLNFDTKIEYKELEDELGFSAGFRYKQGVATTKANARFLKASKSNSYSITATYSGNYQFKDMGLSDPILSARGMQLSQNPERWSQTCGDFYNVSKSYGGKIFFTIRIDFKSKEAKQEFEARFSFSSPVTDVTAKLGTFQKEFSKSTQVKVIALQLGGDVTRLSNIFNDPSGVNLPRVAMVEEDASFDMVKCSLGTFTDCQKVLKRAISYATSDFPKQFRKKNINDPLDHLRPNASLMSLTYAPYSSAGIFVGFSSQMNMAIKETRKDMELDFDKVLGQFQRSQSILENVAIKKSLRQLNKLRNMKSTLFTQIKKMSKSAEVCLNEPLECANEYERSRIGSSSHPNRFKLYPDDDFVIELETYEQYCDFGLSPFSTEELSITIKHMVNAAKVDDLVVWENLKKQDLDICYASFKILRGLKKLNLNLNNQIKIANTEPEKLEFYFDNLYDALITDVRPIMALNHWREIDLSLHAIEDSSFFTDLPHLNKFELRGNLLYDIMGLLKYRELTYLGLSDNNLSSADSISSLSKIRLLDIRNNPGVISCPFAESIKCLLVDISSNNQLFSIHRPHSIRRWGHSAITLKNGDVLLTGGAGDRNSTRGEVYNDYMGTFDLVASLNRQRYEHRSSLLLDGRVLITGGWSALNSGELYNPRTKQFHLIKRPLIQGRADHGTIVLNSGEVLISGGYTGAVGQFSGLDSSASSELFVPSRNRFQSLPSMKVPRAGHTMTKLPSGEVVLIGGFHPRKSLVSIEIYDPRLKRFRFARARLNQGRGYHTAHLLKDGRIAILGGYSSRTNAIDTIEIYDPINDKMEFAKVVMRAARGRHQSILLDHGGILVLGGDEKLTPSMNNHSTPKNAHTLVEMIDLQMSRATPLRDSLAFERVDFQVSKVGGKRILITGGEGTVQSVTAELFEY